MTFNFEKDWVTEAGFRALVVATPMGHRCGYVGVPNGHLHYGKDYNDLDVDIHGGLTFSNIGGFGAPKDEDEPLYWFGFDCAHYMDAKDLSIMDETHRKIHEMYPRYDMEGAVVRDLAFCERECEKLARQLKKP